MFKKHGGYKKRSNNILFVIFRMLLSLAIFALLLGGVYSAYKHFSGVDPLTLDPKTAASNYIDIDSLEQVVFKILALALPQRAADKAVEDETETNTEEPDVSKTVQAVKSPPVAFKFMLFADSHNDNGYLKRAIAQITKSKPEIKFIIGLGDYTEVGTIDELRAAKKELDEGGVRYFVTAGDHDLWDARDKQREAATNFVQVFGPPYQSFSYSNARFLLIYNSDNYLGLGQQQWEWLNSELTRIRQESDIKLTLAFMHEPLYHPSSERVMGKVEKKLKQEARSLIGLLKDAGVKEVFSGDIHFFTRYKDPESDLSMTTAGGITSTRNTQSPRFVVVTVFEDGSYSIEDVEIR